MLRSLLENLCCFVQHFLFRILSNLLYKVKNKFPFILTGSLPESPLLYWLKTQLLKSIIIHIYIL